MAKFSDFEVDLSKDENQLPIVGSDVNYLGENLSPGSFKVSVRPLSGQARFYPFVVPTFGKIVPLPNSSGNLFASIYDNEIELVERGPRLHYPLNALRILEIRYGGYMTLWELALVRQRGSYFFTVQKNYELRCYDGINAGHGDIVCPFFDEWPAMRAFIHSLLWNEPNFLGSYVEYVESYAPPTPPGVLKPGQGEVSWYNYAQGMGCIKVYEPKKNGNPVYARVRWSGINSTGFKCLQVGNRVMCGEVRRVHYPRSKFYWEVFGVSP